MKLDHKVKALDAAIRAVEESWFEPDTGIVGAAVFLPGVGPISSCSRKASRTTFLHAEAVLLDRLANLGVLDLLSSGYLATTLTPCMRPSSSRVGPSCFERLVEVGVRSVYTGAIDQLQPDVEVYWSEGLEIELATDCRQTRVCGRLSQIFQDYGALVNRDILKVKREVGIGIFG